MVFMLSNYSQINKLLELKKCKRSIELYLRALWGESFSLECSDIDKDIPHSRVSGNKIILPNKIYLDQNHINYYRASAVHASLHFIYGNRPFEIKQFNLMQRSLIGLVEDLRIELLAIKIFPGLKSLWLAFHPQSETQNSALSLMARLSRSVLDADYKDESQWVQKGRNLIHSNTQLLHDANKSKDIGLILANDLGQMRMPLNSGKYEQLVIYRDDNSCLWQDIKEVREKTGLVDQNDEFDITQKQLKEEFQGTELMFSEIENNDVNGYVVFEKDVANLEYNKHDNKPKEIKYTYPEWDYRSWMLKKDWCTLEETMCVDSSAVKVEKIFDAHRITLNRLRHIAKSLQMQKRQKIRRLVDGDDLDLDSVIGAMVSLHSGEAPDTRVFVRDDYRHVKSLSISILIDLSESTNQMVNEEVGSIVELMQAAVLLLGETLDIAGEEFSISGFSSNGRHNINFIKYKEYSEKFSASKARLAGIKGEYSTRLGAAIRHAGNELAQRNSMKRLLLVITDGAPSDIDVYDKQYLERDSWHAVNELSRQNIKAFCINLDSAATPAMQHIFGKGKFETLDIVTRLPEVLSGIYIKYARH